MNEQQLWLLRRIAERGLQSDMDVGIGANMLTALLDYVDELRASPAQLEEGHTNAVSFPNDIATLARAYLDVATFPSWNAGDCRFCGLFGEHAHDCAYGRTEEALLRAVSLPQEQSTSGPLLEETRPNEADDIVLWFFTEYTRLPVDGEAYRALLNKLRNLRGSDHLRADLERAVLEIDDLRNALEAQSRTVVRMRAALEEAEEELGLGQLMHALAAIGRGLNHEKQ